MKDIVLLKQALPYLRRHKGKTMVVKLGGELVADPAALRSLAEDLSLLDHVGVRVVIVHGGGPQATAMSERLGLAPQMVEGRRVTDAETLDVAKMVFAGKINVDLISALKAQGVRAVGLSGVAAGILQAERRSPVEVLDADTGRTSIVDYGHVGDVRAVDTALLSLLMGNGYVPVLSSLGGDAEGNILNINADTVASVLARDLGAAKLLLLTGVPGLLADPDDEASLVPVLTSSQARALLGGGALRGGMKPKLQALVDAVDGGVDRGHILSGRRSGSLLLELFTQAGSGTLLVRDDDEPAVPSDAAAALVAQAGVDG